MVKLKCDNCGGPVERDESQVIVTSNTVTVRVGCDFECQFCGSKFAAETEHTPISGGGAIAVGGSVAAGAGGIAIGGSVKGDIVIGRKG